jgi:hypothetical protein
MNFSQTVKETTVTSTVYVRLETSGSRKIRFMSFFVCEICVRNLESFWIKMIYTVLESYDWFRDDFVFSFTNFPAIPRERHLKVSFP